MRRFHSGIRNCSISYYFTWKCGYLHCICIVLIKNQFEAFQKKVVHDFQLQAIKFTCTVLCLIYVGFFELIWWQNEKKRRIFRNNVVKEAIMLWSLKQYLKFIVKLWILIFCMYFSKNGVRRMLCSISTTAKGIMNYLDFVSVDEKQVTDV